MSTPLPEREPRSPSSRAGSRAPLLLRLPGVAILGCVALAATVTTGVAYERRGGADSATASFSDVTGIVITTGPADIEIVAADRRDIAVTTRRTWVGNKPATSAVIVDHELRLDSSCPILAWVSFSGEPCRVRYRIEAPSDLAVRVDVELGDVEVSSMAGQLIVNSIRGDVRIRNGLHDRATLHAGFGDVTARFVVAPTSVEVESAAGAVTVEVPAGTYDVAIESATGSATVDGITAVEGAEAQIEVVAGFGDATIFGRPVDGSRTTASSGPETTVVPSSIGAGRG